MNADTREAKNIIRGFLASQPDEYLARVVDAIRSETFCYEDRRCCFRGLAPGGYDLAQSDLYWSAERALRAIGRDSFSSDRPFPLSEPFTPSLLLYLPNIRREERLRRVRVLPMVLNELRRRERRRDARPVEVTVGV